MGGVAESIRSSIAAVKDATDTIQETVVIERHLPGSDDALGGGSTFDQPDLEQALVARKEGLLKTPTGKEIDFRAIVSFLGPMNISTKDRITLSDGMTGPLMEGQGGLTDPTTKKPFLRSIYIR